MATAMFVIGVPFDRNSGESHHDEAAGSELRPLGVDVEACRLVALDMRELVHQLDENRDGLALLAGAIAVLHTAAAVIAALLISRAQDHRAPAGASGTIPA